MFKKLLTRTLVSAVLAATASTAFAADATDWPKRPIQVVVPAGADLVAVIGDMAGVTPIIRNKGE